MLKQSHTSVNNFVISLLANKNTHFPSRFICILKLIRKNYQFSLPDIFTRTCNIINIFGISSNISLDFSRLCRCVEVDSLNKFTVLSTFNFHIYKWMFKIFNFILNKYLKYSFMMFTSTFIIPWGNRMPDFLVIILHYTTTHHINIIYIHT